MLDGIGINGALGLMGFVLTVSQRSIAAHVGTATSPTPAQGYSKAPFHPNPFHREVVGGGPISIPSFSLPAATSILKRQKQLRRKNVRFDQVTVYYFARRQGFTSVPSQGGSSLGMAPRHNSVRSYTLCEFAQEQEVNHREILREHLKEEKLHAKKMKV